MIEFKVFGEGEVGYRINSTNMTLAPVVVEKGSVVDNGVPAYSGRSLKFTVLNKIVV
jgi:hypothetical protein